MKEIDRIIDLYNQIDWSECKAALGTVVQVEGSSYRRIGARMFVASNGTWTGGISGGCLEGDALKKAQLAMINNASHMVIYDTREGDSFQIGVGLGCEGRIEVLFTPINPYDSGNQIRLLQGISRKRTHSVLFHVLRSSQSSDPHIGKVYLPEGLDTLNRQTKIPVNTLNDLYDLAVKSKTATIAAIKLPGSNLSYDVLVEFIPPKIKLIIVGNNYDIEALVNVGDELGWLIQIIGNKAKLSKSVFEKCENLYSLDEIDHVSVDDYSAVVLMAHNYAIDSIMLLHFINKSPSYLGLLGPRKRMIRMQKEFNRDFDSNPCVYSPAGLDIGAETPEEIALSISSEIIASFRKRDGGRLKDRKTPIHVRD